MGRLLRWRWVPAPPPAALYSSTEDAGVRLGERLGEPPPKMPPGRADGTGAPAVGRIGSGLIVITRSTIAAMPSQRRAIVLQVALGRRVRELREARGWSQERLAEASGLHWTYVGRVERGQRNLSLHSLAALARGLRVSLSDLFRDID